MRRHKYLLFSLLIGFVTVAGLLLSLGSAAQAARAAPGEIFVMAGASGDGSQADPRDLASALVQAVHGDVLYLAGGVYTGTGDAVVRLEKSISLLGGWDGAPSGPVVRDPAAHPSVLHGERLRRGVFISGTITPTLDGLTLTAGDATSATMEPGYGGGLYVFLASPTIRNNRILSNVAAVSPTIGRGGGVYLRFAASALISGNEILSNTTGEAFDGHGGGLYSYYSHSTVRGNRVEDNRSSMHGGGLFLDGVNPGVGAPQLLNNEIRDNVSGRNGGGLYFQNVLGGLVQGNLIRDNLAVNGWHGGGMLLIYSNPIINANRIVSNTARTSAGVGLLTPHRFTVTNNLIAYNSDDGVTLWDPVADGLVAHNTIVHNGGSGGIYLRYDYITPTIVNNIVVSNVVGIGAQEFSSGTLDYNLVWGNQSQDYMLPGALQPGPHSLQADPRFVGGASGDDYHLRPGSPAVDAGMDTDITMDLDGETRPDGVGYDIGADEVLLWRLYLPLLVRDG